MDTNQNNLQDFIKQNFKIFGTSIYKPDCPAHMIKTELERRKQNVKFSKISSLSSEVLIFEKKSSEVISKGILAMKSNKGFCLYII